MPAGAVPGAPSSAMALATTSVPLRARKAGRRMPAAAPALGRGFHGPVGLAVRMHEARQGPVGATDLLDRGAGSDAELIVIVHHHA